MFSFEASFSEVVECGRGERGFAQVIRIVVGGRDSYGVKNVSGVGQNGRRSCAPRGWRWPGRSGSAIVGFPSTQAMQINAANIPIMVRFRTL
jgi:hypothetical protein